MSATTELFEKYKLRLGVHADSAGAMALGIKSQTVSNWRTRGSQAEPWLIEKMTMALGIDTTEWLVRVQVEQSPDVRNKEVWRRLGKRLGYKLTVIGALLMSPMALFGNGPTGLVEGFGYEASQAVLVTGDWLLSLP